MHSFLVKYLAPISIIIIIVASFATLGTKFQAILVISGVKAQEKQFSRDGHCLLAFCPLYGKMQDENSDGIFSPAAPETAGIRPWGRFGRETDGSRCRNRSAVFALVGRPQSPSKPSKGPPIQRPRFFSEHFPAKPHDRRPGGG